MRPTNVMVASKRVCELLLQNRPMRRTRCAAVRFANEHEIAGYVRMGYCDRATAFDLVKEQRHDAAATAQDHLRGCRPGLASGAMAKHGEIFILDMGEPVRIAHLARQLIFLSGRSETEVPIIDTCPPWKRKTLSASPSERPKSLRRRPVLASWRPARPPGSPKSAREENAFSKRMSGSVAVPGAFQVRERERFYERGRFESHSFV